MKRLLAARDRDIKVADVFPRADLLVELDRRFVPTIRLDEIT